MPALATCPCRHCGGHIEFDATDFDKDEARLVECPHCHAETVLSIPLPSPATTPEPFVSSLPKDYTLTKERKKLVENHLELIGRFFMAVGIIGVIVAGFCIVGVCVMDYGNTHGTGNTVEDIFWIVGGGFALWLQCFILKTLFFALAEIVRLLRKT